MFRVMWLYKVVSDFMCKGEEPAVRLASMRKMNKCMTCQDINAFDKKPSCISRSSRTYVRVRDSEFHRKGQRGRTPSFVIS